MKFSWFHLMPYRWLPQDFPNYESLLAAAADAAVRDPASPKDLTQWRWGAFAPIDIEHPVLGRLPLIDIQERTSGPELIGGNHEGSVSDLDEI